MVYLKRRVAELGETLKIWRVQESQNQRHYAKLEELDEELCKMFDSEGLPPTIEAVDTIRMVVLALFAERQRADRAECQLKDMRDRLVGALQQLEWTEERNEDL
jgi:hypothetical protein